ncbi:MAG: hypothetical protein E7Z80_01975 [Methanobrevibacter thaueri]|nr:hypothetical protein [Methanobrevibacter thaueri]
MSKRKKIHHPNDVVNIYLSTVIPEILHQYFKLPGKFVKNYTTKIIRKDGTEGQMDWLYLVEPDNQTLFEEILINVEFQSSKVTKEKIKIIADYRDYAKIYYGLPVFSVIIIIDGYESSEYEYFRVPSDIIKPYYIYISWKEIIEKLNNLEEKISNQKQLTKDEGLDMIFASMHAPKNDANWITERLIFLFSNYESLNKPFYNYIGYGLSIMIKKYFEHTSKGEELLNMLEPEVSDSKLRIVAEYELEYEREGFELKLKEKDNAIAEKNNAIAEKDSTIAEKEKSIATKNKEIEELKKKLKENGIKY